MPINGTVQATGEFAPSASGDTYAILDAKYMRDGFRNVNLLSDLDLITADRRIAGMVVGVSGGTAYYKLGTSPWAYTISDWSVFTTGGGGDSYWVSGSTGMNSIKALNPTGLDATGDYAVAEGSGTLASGNYSHAEGITTTAIGQASHVEGRSTIASGNYSHAEGRQTESSGIGSHAEGHLSLSSGLYSHAEGDNTTSSGQSSHAEGTFTTSLGASSHSEGYNSVSSGVTAHAEGDQTLAGGDASHSEGTSSKALGFGAHAEGQQTTADGNFSHAEGDNTTASGVASHSEGQYTTASGTSSHAGGYFTISDGNYSFVHGYNSIASGQTTIVLGTNITGTSANTTYINNLNIKDIVSASTASTKTNLVIDSNGDVYKSNGPHYILLRINQIGTSAPTLVSQNNNLGLADTDFSFAYTGVGEYGIYINNLPAPMTDNGTFLFGQTYQGVYVVNLYWNAGNELGIQVKASTTGLPSNDLLDYYMRIEIL